jgi:NAD(P)-dependent dehydrogenase (short-subunit alcohol dehydrogenase family)
MTTSRLKDKTAIITGAAGGIGAATAKLFAREGANLMLVDVDGAALKQLAAALEIDNVTYAVADVGDAEQTAGYVDKTVERFGGVDVLYANAGVEGKVTPLTDLTEADFDRVWRVNVRGVWLAIRAAAPQIVARGGGSIIATSSVAGLVGSPGLGAYVTSKHGVMGLVRVAALELAAQNIRVNAINPGPLDNRMMRSIESQAAPADPDAVKRNFETTIPLHRYGTSEEIAKLALFLASDDSSYCTGGSFVADGGFLAQ